jgi:hypothetical protein
LHVAGTALTRVTEAVAFWPGRKNGGKMMGKLVTASQFADPDAAYVALVDARRGLSEQAAAALDARLVLLLANHIGDIDVLREAITVARKDNR